MSKAKLTQADRDRVEAALAEIEAAILGPEYHRLVEERMGRPAVKIVIDAAETERANPAE